MALIHPVLHRRYVWLVCGWQVYRCTLVADSIVSGLLKPRETLYGLKNVSSIWSELYNLLSFRLFLVGFANLTCTPAIGFP